MATGLDMQLIQRRGEYLVVAELCRRGYLATTFSGNVPDFDIIAVDDKLRAIPVQVKAARASWQFNAERFLEIEKKQGLQRVLGRKKLRNPKVVWVFVYLGDEQNPEFYLLTEQQVQDILYREYVRNLEAKGGRRPRNPGSTHEAIDRMILQEYRDNWDIVAESLKTAPSPEEGPETIE